MNLGAIASAYLQPTGTVDRMYAVWADDRERLIATAQTLFAGQWSGKDPFLRIVLPCGNVREWQTPELVPSKSIRCFCPDLDVKEHWFIKYGEER